MKLLRVRISFIRCTKSSVGGCKTSLVFKVSLQACIPSSCGMFVYKDLMSRVTSKVSGGKSVRSGNLYKKSVVSLT